MKLRPDEAELMAKLMEEASQMLRQVPDEIGEKIQLRHFLPDELDGSAIMLRDHFKESALTREQAIDIARKSASKNSMDHDYLFQAGCDPQNWHPHEWVIEAIMSAGGRL